MFGKDQVWELQRGFILGQFGYSEGSHTPASSLKRLELILLDIAPMISQLGGVKMELQDCAFPLVDTVIASVDPLEAFKDIDVALLVGAMPRGPGMERKDLLTKNASIFKAQGKALDAVAKKTVKVLVVGNPANTNAYIASSNAPSIPKENFTALTRLDQVVMLGAGLCTGE